LNKKIKTYRPFLLIAISLVVVLGLMLQKPIAQDVLYHNFEDANTYFDISNFWNVVSNLPFFVVGFLGLLQLNKLKIIALLKPAYFTLFLGVLLVSFGSGYYHLAPNNQTLVWDRLPMTIAFMALFTIIIGEFISVSLAKKLFYPLLILGLASVYYWYSTAQNGVGDLRFYVLIQFLPMLLIPVILLIYPSRFNQLSAYWYLLLAYLLAKVFEHYDMEIHQLLGAGISGHPIKHVVAAIGMYVLLRSYEKRNNING
jgi:hypothetical protein